MSVYDDCSVSHFHIGFERLAYGDLKDFLQALVVHAEGKF